MDRDAFSARSEDSSERAALRGAVISVKHKAKAPSPCFGYLSQQKSVEPIMLSKGADDNLSILGKFW